ncbi:diguanylate cyclase [Lentzea sp. NPDC092896]|uniref:GGDEF domain-containing protein n=1 Tax=Lentzea sp. NPDC092896 TaxID=3364127 RepID=UPI00380CE681
MGNRPPLARGITSSSGAISLSCARLKRYIRWVIDLQSMQWALWKNPSALVVWLLAVDVVIGVWAAVTSAFAVVRVEDLLRFIPLAAFALAHVIATREPEERRRDAARRGEHVDQTSIWLFTAAIVSPAPLVLALLFALRMDRYRYARKGLHRFVFTTAAIAASVLGVYAVARWTPLHAWMTGVRALPMTAGEQVTAAAAMAAALAVYFLAQAVIVGVARALVISGRKTLVDLVGDSGTNLFILVTLFMAAMASALVSVSWALAVIMVVVAVHSTRTHQRVQQLSSDLEQRTNDAFTDRLTGLRNRHGFEPLVALALTTDQALGNDTALLFIDIDWFKRVNEEFGHVGGDEVLAAVARRIRASVRDKDVVGRFGGEEFIVLLPATGRQDALALAERIRLDVARLTIEVRKPAGGQTHTINPDGLAGQGRTVSIGVALAPVHGSTLDVLADRGSHAVLRAKELGRDRVVVAADSGPAVPPQAGLAATPTASLLEAAER